MKTRAAQATGPPSGVLVQTLRRQLGARLVETHVSWVLLDGVHAWKIKKPLRLPFLDARALATRARLCREELRLNRRLAPSLYLDVVAIRGSVHAPRLEGIGPAIDYALRMRQFPAGALFSEQLAAGTLRPQHLEQLAQRLADFHREAAVAGPATPWGTSHAIEADTRRLLESLQAQGAATECATLRAWVDAQVPRLGAAWQARRDAGRVREGHGDLHLANAVRLGDDVTAFDCVEFDPALRWIDVVSDIGFLVMDLLAHGRGDLGYRFLDAYLDASGDHEGIVVLRWYLVYRALVRALVARIRSGQDGGATAAPDYLGLALRLAGAGDARLLITHGLSGSGKSHLALRLLAQAQAIRLRSDVERKRLHGLGAQARTTSAPGGGIYSPVSGRRTYARLREAAEIALRAGERVVVDAAFLQRGDREALRDLAQDLGVPFTILHCRAPETLLRDRVQSRHTQGSDASEADVAVLGRQRDGVEPLTAAEQAHAVVVDTSVPVDVAALSARWLAWR